MCYVKIKVFSSSRMCTKSKLITLIYLFLVLCLGETTGNTTRTQRDTDCFKCKSGECVNSDQECDGTVDCKDGSDETNACARLRCPSFLFRCAYGACISPSLQCDGKNDCKDGSDESGSKCKKFSGQCRNDQFKCASGQCVLEEYKCDGVAQCDDTTDENFETCGKIKCPRFSHKCAYGACVDGGARCNGVVECHDHSDEDPAICNPTEVTTISPPVTLAPPLGKKCVLPEHPAHGQWVIGFGPSTLQPGAPVDTGTVLTFTCQNQYKLQGTALILCNPNNTWSTPPPTCAALCPELRSSETITFRCSRNGFLANCAEPEHGTIATYQCKYFYENVEKVPSRKCVDGSWNRPVPVCDPICGQKSVKAKPLVVNGTNVTRGDYPWQMALYILKNQKREFQCGGSLISLKYAISAAHCVCDYHGTVFSTELFEIGVGQYYRNYGDPRDSEAQHSSIRKIYVPPEYRGDDANWQADIAVLEATITFEASNRVLPVCVDYNGNYEDKILKEPDVKGYVTGWGYTQQSGSPSEVLKEVEAPYVPDLQCKEQLPHDFEIFLSHDKMCAGYIGKGTAVCNGDSGGGLVFRNSADRKYYLTGIVSVSPITQGGECNSNQYGLYTRVSKYIGFIYEKTL